MSSRSTLYLLALGAALLGAHTAQAAGDKPAAPPAATGTAKANPAPAKLIDINSASKAQLKTLPGIGDAEAERIIAARPYPSKAKLGADKVVSEETYWAIKGLVVAVQPEPPKAKAAGKAASKP
jgi:DNA uptake protein ComE-like DNA-binding protein